MKKLSIPMRTFESYPGSKKSKALRLLVDRAVKHTNGSSSILSQIHEYESRSGMSSVQMIAKLNAGEIRETQEITNWLIAWESRKLADKKSSSTRSK